MKKIIYIALLVASCFHISLVQASDNYINKKSPYSVPVTLDRLQSALESKGITIFVRVDHGAGAKKVNTPLQESQLLIFGNPKLGSPLMKEAPMMGLDLPMKALAWKDANGQVWLSYLKPSVLQNRHQLKQTGIIKKMAGALNAMTNKAIEK